MSQAPSSSDLSSQSPQSQNSPLFIEGSQGVVTYQPGSAQLLQGTLKQIRPLGGGHFGDVWLEEWTRPDGRVTQVAVKYLRQVEMRSTPSAEGERVLKRLNREKAVWQRLRHKNVLPLLAYTLGATPALISQYCSNGNLPIYTKKQPLRFIHKLKLVTEIARGMTYLHALNPPVCHGDLKPENVLVSGDGEALISDLGLSEAYRSTSAGWSTSGVTQGTRHYRSYELLFENQQTLAGDVYAFGCLVLTVLSGKVPFAGESETFLAQATENETMPETQNHPELPASSPIWPLLFRCWARSQDARPKVAEVYRTLEGHLGQRAQAQQFDA